MTLVNSDCVLATFDTPKAARRLAVIGLFFVSMAGFAAYDVWSGSYGHDAYGYLAPALGLWGAYYAVQFGRAFYKAKSDGRFIYIANGNLVIMDGQGLSIPVTELRDFVIDGASRIALRRDQGSSFRVDVRLAKESRTEIAEKLKAVIASQ